MALATLLSRARGITHNTRKRGREKETVVIVAGYLSLRPSFRTRYRMACGLNEVLLQRSAFKRLENELGNERRRAGNFLLRFLVIVTPRST